MGQSSCKGLAAAPATGPVGGWLRPPGAARAQQLLQVGVAHHGVPVHGLAGRGLSDTGPLGLPTGAATQTPEPSPYLTGHPGQSEARARGPGLHTLLPCLLLSPTDTETLTCRQGVGPWTRHSQAQPARSPCY